jgi:hypothetical protein
MPPDRRDPAESINSRNSAAGSTSNSPLALRHPAAPAMSIGPAVLRGVGAPVT